MKVHEKAKLYDELINDVELFIAKLEEHHQKVDNIRKDFEIPTNDPYYYSKLSGSYEGTNFGLSLKINSMKGTLNYFKSLK